MPAVTALSATYGFGRPQTAAAGSGDKILDSLTTSAAAYTAASAGTWIKITETEFNTMQTNVTGTNKAGTTDTTFNAIGTSTNFSVGALSGYNQTSAATPAIPANNYLYAFKIYINEARSDLRVYANNSSDTYVNGFQQRGGVLPTSVAGTNYYVLKGVSAVINAGAATSLLFFTGDVLRIGFKTSVGASGIKYDMPGSATPPTVSTNINSTFGSASAFAIQGLTTATKQWP